MKKVYVKKRAIRLLYKANKTIPFDEIFCYLPFYQILKIFKVYNKIKQYDKSKY